MSIASQGSPGGKLAELSDSLELDPASIEILILGSLPLGAHLILRCRKDWRTATVVAITLEKITLSVSAPSGRTYRVRRPPETPLTLEGSIPVLGTGSWRGHLSRYDPRW